MSRLSCRNEISGSCQLQQIVRRSPRVFLAPSDKWIDYFLCDQSGFCFVPEMYAWSFDEFGKHIYNQDYEAIDPDYKHARPQSNAQLIEQLFAGSKIHLRHLDYGGGSGLLSRILCGKGWDSTTYDPFSMPMSN